MFGDYARRCRLFRSCVIAVSSVTFLFMLLLLLRSVAAWRGHGEGGTIAANHEPVAVVAAADDDRT